MGMISEGHARPVAMTGPGRTKQSMKEETDVNNIMRKFAKTGLITHLAQGIPQYVDVSVTSDYREALENVRGVQKYFMKLPAKVRQAFDNDPTAFLDYITSPETSVEDLTKLGLEALGDRRRPRRADDAQTFQNRTADGRFTEGTHTHGDDPHAAGEGGKEGEGGTRSK